MQFKTYLKSKLPLYLALSSLFMLASCGSYQYVGNDSDGIYSSSNGVTTTVETQPNNNYDNSYYKGYFAEKSQKYEKIAQDENVIFTDIDNYEGTYNQVTGKVEYEESYAGWGQNSSGVTINVYDNNWGLNNGWNNWGWNGGWGYGFNNWGWYGGFNNWGWNNGWGYGFNNWGWNGGWGHGFNNWGWNSGFGWCAPYAAYGGYYGYHNNNVAFNTTRRGNYVVNSGRNSAQYEARANTTRRNSATSNRNSNTSRYNPANSVRSTTRSNNTDVRSINNRRSNTNRSNDQINSPTRSTRSSSPRVNTPSRSSNSSPAVRSSSPSRSSSGGSSSGRSSGSSSRRGG